MIPYPLTAGFIIEVEAEQQLAAPEVEERIAEIWEEELAARPGNLFNGRVLSLESYAPGRLGVRICDYKHLLGQLRAPELGPVLAIRPVAVSGIIGCGDGVILGRRSALVTEAPCCWEAAPSGGLDRPDAYGQLYDEALEELGIGREALSCATALALIDDAETHLCEVLFRLETTFDAARVTAAHAESASNEYSAVAIVAVGHLAAFCSANASQLAPALTPALHLAGLLEVGT